MKASRGTSKQAGDLGLLASRAERRLGPGLFLAGGVGERGARFVAKDFVEHVQRADAVDAKAAERVALLAPGGERPHRRPVIAAQRSRGAGGGRALGVGVVETDASTRRCRVAQPPQALD